MLGSIVRFYIFCCIVFVCFEAYGQPLSLPAPVSYCDTSVCDTLNMIGPLTYTTSISPSGGDSVCYVTITYWKRRCNAYYDVIIDNFSYHGANCSTLGFGTIISRVSAMLLMNQLGDIPLPFPPYDSIGSRTWRVIKPSCWQTQPIPEHGYTKIEPCIPYRCCVSYYRASRSMVDCYLQLTYIPTFTMSPECVEVSDPRSFQNGCLFHCEENVLNSFQDAR